MAVGSSGFVNGRDRDSYVTSGMDGSTTTPPPPPTVTAAAASARPTDGLRYDYVESDNRQAAPAGHTVHFDCDVISLG
ncbi:hypothetical protein J6590_010426 [Homalodisca vitripennis]|nr:hypothetical protein J6590_010426 [Homalodisca vitripennis]